MENSIRIKLDARGMGLEVQAPSFVASGIIDLLRFEVTTSQEWGGMALHVLFRLSDGRVFAFPVTDGVATSKGSVIDTVGGAYVALHGQKDGKRLTTAEMLFNVVQGI